MPFTALSATAWLIELVTIQTSEVLKTSEVSCGNRRSAAWFGPTIVAAMFCSLLVLTWRKWPHILVDFGRELYVPWRISEGAVLYRDIAYFNGPFSPYFNAALFQLFGVSLTTLIVANIVLLGVLLGLIYHTFSRWFDRLTATITSMVFLCAFGFAQLDMAGNYNYICPYSHEMTHGIFFGLIALLALGSALNHALRRRRDWVCLVVAGLSWGVVFLGKPEIFVATSGAIAVSFGLQVWTRNTTIGQALLALSVFGLCGLLPVAAFLAMFSRQLPWDQSLLCVAGSWQWIFSSDVTSQYFYRWTAGLDQPLRNLLLMARAVGRVSLFLVIALCYNRWLAGGRSKPLVAIVGLLCLGGLWMLRNDYAPFLLDGRAMLAAAVLLLGVLSAFIWIRRKDTVVVQRLAPLIPFAVLGVLLLGKMMLNPKIQHYGFVLAMPATLLAAACLLHYGPAIIGRWSRGSAFRNVIACALLLDAVGYVLISSDHFGDKTCAVGKSGDRIMAASAQSSDIGPAVNRALHEIERTVPPSATLAVLPEGIMINYLTRRQNPTPYINFMPPELVAYGEQRIALSLRERRPDFVLLVHKKTTEYGVGFFGCDEYGREIMHWVKRNYREVKTIGAEPLCGDDFGIKLLERNDRAT